MERYEYTKEVSLVFHLDELGIQDTVLTLFLLCSLKLPSLEQCRVPLVVVITVCSWLRIVRDKDSTAGD